MLMIAMPFVWFLVWYVAWFDYDDCLGAPRQIGTSNDARYRSTQVECRSAETVLRAVEFYGLAALALAEFAMWFVTRRRQ